MVNIIEVKNLYKKYLFTYALKDIDLSIGEGEHTLILGSNGSGKSTLIKILTGLVKPSKGYVKVLGMKPFNNFRKLSKYVGVLLDDYKPPWWLSGYDFLKYVAYLKNIDFDEVNYFANKLNVTQYWFKPVFTYSEGMKKKISIIQALVGKPKLLFLDDPFSNLDPQSRKILINLLMELSDNTTLIISSHVIMGLSEITKKAVVLDDGKKIFEGNIENALKYFEIGTHF